MQPIEAPRVDNLSDIMAELAPSTQGQEDVINARKTGLEDKYAAQQQQLDAKKIKGFNDINTSATGRGMAFSGIPLDEQANYLSTEYMPQMAQLEYQKNEEGMGYDQQLADLFSQRYGMAWSKQNTQENNLFNWNSQLQNQNWQSGENKLGRDFTTSERLGSQQYGTSEREAGQTWTAGQNQINRNWQTGERIAGQEYGTSERIAGQQYNTSERIGSQNFTAGQNAANRAASAPQGLTSGQITTALSNIIAGTTEHPEDKKLRVGSDTFMRPSDWRDGYFSFFRDTGEGPETYTALMSGYVNPDSAEEYRL